MEAEESQIANALAVYISTIYFVEEVAMLWTNYQQEDCICFQRRKNITWESTSMIQLEYVNLYISSGH